MNNQSDQLKAIQESLRGVNPPPRALVVDDDVDDLELMTLKLRRSGIDVTSVRSGEAALALIPNAGYWVVFLDWKMEGMSGLETLIEIKKLNTDSSVIVITGWPTKEVISAAFSAGAAAVMPKPLEDESIKLIFNKP